MHTIEVKKHESFIRRTLHGVHNFLLMAHVGMVVDHSIEAGNFGLEFWLTLIVNGLLLINLEKWMIKLLPCKRVVI